MADQLAARDVELVLQAQRQRHRRHRLLQLAVVGVDRRDARAPAARQHGRPRRRAAARRWRAGRRSRGSRSASAPPAGPDHPLHREARGLLVGVVVGHLHLLEQLEQHRAVVPGHARRALDHVVAVQRRHRDVGDAPRRRLQLLGEAAELLRRAPRSAPASSSTRSILLIATTICGMPSSALMNAWRLDCSSTPRRASISTTETSAVEAPVTMLRVYWRWPGQSAMMKRRLGGREVAVGHVDRDALLALGAQAVGQQRQVERALAAAALAGLRDVLELVLEHLLGVVQQPPDQRALAVVHRARRREAQQVERHRCRLRSLHARRRAQRAPIKRLAAH